MNEWIDEWKNKLRNNDSSKLKGQAGKIKEGKRKPDEVNWRAHGYSTPANSSHARIKLRGARPSNLPTEAEKCGFLCEIFPGLSVGNKLNFLKHNID